MAQVLRINIFKNLNGAGSRGEWVNTYEVETDLATDAPAVQTAAREIAIVESKFHLNSVVFTRATISTYKKEVAPEDDDNNEVILGFNGMIVDEIPQGQTSRQLPPEVCLVVKRKAGKRAGRMTYRHAIATQDWVGTGDGVRLVTPKIEYVNSLWATYLQQNNGTVPLVRAYKGAANGSPAKPVSSMVCIGSQNRQLDARRKKKGSNPSAIPTETEGILAKTFELVKAARVAVAGRYTGPLGAALARADENLYWYPISVLATEIGNAIRAVEGRPALPMPEFPALPPAP